MARPTNADLHSGSAPRHLGEELLDWPVGHPFEGMGYALTRDEYVEKRELRDRAVTYPARRH